MVVLGRATDRETQRPGQREDASYDIRGVVAPGVVVQPSEEPRPTGRAENADELAPREKTWILAHPETLSDQQGLEHQDVADGRSEEDDRDEEQHDRVRQPDRDQRHHLPRGEHHHHSRESEPREHPTANEAGHNRGQRERQGRERGRRRVGAFLGKSHQLLDATHLRPQRQHVADSHRDKEARTSSGLVGGARQLGRRCVGRPGLTVGMEANGLGIRAHHVPAGKHRSDEEQQAEPGRGGREI